MLHDPGLFFDFLISWEKGVPEQEWVLKSRDNQVMSSAFVTQLQPFSHFCIILARNATSIPFIHSFVHFAKPQIRK